KPRSVASGTAPLQQPLAGWVSDLESTNYEVVQAARQALADLGPDAAPAIPRLVQLLTNAQTCNSAAVALVNIGSNSLPALLDALTNENKYARLEVAGAIGQIGDAGEEAIPGLLECIKSDTDPGVRGNAIASLQTIGKRPEVAVPALLAAVADPDA